MKIKSLILVFIVVAAFAFAGSRPPKQPLRAAVNIDGVYKFTGNLNGKIPIFVWFVVKDSVVKGEVTYLKTAKRIPITVIGTIDKTNTLELFEFAKGGYITGIYRGLFNRNVLTGTWGAPNANKELKYNFTPKDTALTVTDTDLKPTAIDGSYEYHYSKNNGGDGGIDIKHIKGAEYFMELNAVTSSPANNVAEIERTKVVMNNNTIIYKVPEGDCKYRIRVFKNFVVINRLSEYGGCFGMGAGPEGVFIKVKDVPAFAF